MKYLLLSYCFFIIGMADAQSLPIKPKDVKTLSGYMAGEFTSEAQATADSTFFHVNLSMVPVWTDSKDGYWLYVEQAIATAPDKPYRQRIYHLTQEDDTTIVSQVFEIRNPSQYAGAWKDRELLDHLSQDSLITRQGCGIYLHKVDKETFSGSTPGKQCLSSLRGAKYATSQVVIHPDSIVSWDRGWDIYDKQVWGAVLGGYLFVKTSKFKT
jgi:CpeT protein